MLNLAATYFMHHILCAKIHIFIQTTKSFADYLMGSLLFLAFYSLIRTFGSAESRLHLGNIQINLVFRSIYTTFAPKIVNTYLE